MTPFRRITRPMFRYGDADFDTDYLRWGLHDRDTQIREAESVLNIVKPAGSLRILDLACGIGTHAIHWTKQGHRVTGVDLSATFLDEARQATERESVQVDWVVADLRTLDESGRFDLITWIESSFFDQEIARQIHRALCDGGCFITDIRNPEHPRAKARGGNWRTWREENGVFYLERHETNPATGRREDAWITIDPQRELIEEKTSSGDGLAKSLQIAKVLTAVGFARVEMRTMEGQRFTGGEEPYWLWLVAYK